MTLKTPIFLENDTTTQNADELRLERAYILNQRAGVHTPTSLAVSQRGAGANMSVDVAAGGAHVLGTENALQGGYHVTNDATVNLAITAADLTNPRKDLVIVNVRDSFYSGANNDAQLQVVTGTPAASPAEPNLTALGYKNFLTLALVDVPASDTSITDGQITDRRTRTAAVGGKIICTSSTRPASPWEGLEIWETDTDRNYIYTGSAWRYTYGGNDPTAARAYASGSTSVGTSMTTIALAAESYDYGSCFASNTYTCPRAGLVEANGRVSVVNPTDGQRMIISIFKNGSEAARGPDLQAGGTTVMGGVVFDRLAVAANDTITLRAQMASGTAKTSETGEDQCYLSCRMIP